MDQSRLSRLTAEVTAETVVCRCEEVLLAEMEAAVIDHADGAQQLRNYTRCGMGACQGRMCAASTAEWLAARTGRPLQDIGPPAIGIPAKPLVTLGASRREGGMIAVPLEVRDGDSAVTRVEYSLDAQRWQSAFPQDGILDGRQEQLTLRFDAAMAGRTLVVRATDAMNNVGSGEVLIK